MKTRHLGYAPLLWLLFFVVIPLFLVLGLSFATRGLYGGVEWTFSLENFKRVFEPVYFHIFLQSLKLATLTSLICLALAYPMAWAIATSPSRVTWMVILAIPFLTNLIIRVYAIKVFVGLDGPLQWFLTTLGVQFEPFALTQNPVLVMYGMLTTYLPFMVFPLFAAMEKFDFALVEAAQDLGASHAKVFFSVILPNTKVGALNGFTLVFIPCLGEFVIPDLLGGAKTMLAGNLITEQFLKSRDWPFGAALAVTLMILLFLIPFVLRKIVFARGPA